MSILAQFPLEAQPESALSLDLYSIRQTNEPANASYAVLSQPPECINHAPYFALEITPNSYSVAQGNCHSWICPKCGVNRAKREYRRIVDGCEALSGDNELYFVTITCRGKELSLAESEVGYYGWSNKLLTAWRTSTKRAGGNWIYACVTERQKRGHPHSHIITTAVPKDIYAGTKTNWKHAGGKLVAEEVEALRSDWFEKRCVSAGLGNQYDISLVRDASAASRYVAKYLFKSGMFTEWPKSWHRVRYSRSFPALEELDGNAMVLLTDADWYTLAKRALVVTAVSPADILMCRERLSGHDVLIRDGCR